jgi:hypothetical protein
VLKKSREFELVESEERHHNQRNRNQVESGVLYLPPPFSHCNRRGF